MSDRDHIPLHKSDCALLIGGYQCTCGLHQRNSKTPPALAAEQPKHPGYVIGSHWLETAYSRICAGEAEADVLRDCGWERVDDIEALRRENEQLREENRLWKSRCIALVWKGDTDNITAGRLQSAAKEIDAALRREDV